MGDRTEKKTKKPKKPPDIDEEKGKYKLNHIGDKLLSSIMEHDKETIEDGKLLSEALDNSISSFIPEMMFEEMVKDYAMAKQIYGEKLLRQVTGYNDSYLEKNIRIPEFQRELQKSIEKKIDKLKKEKLLDKKASITEKGIELASVVMYTEELDRIAPKGFMGEKVHKKISIHGEKQDIKQYSKGDRYRDISVHKTVKAAIRRGHKNLETEDMKVFLRKSRGEIYIIYALDASGSMKGNKISSCKKAGIALSYKAIEHKDKVGLIVFGKDVQKKILPTRNFTELLKEIATIRAASETDIAKTIKESILMFPKSDVTKHLVLITDAMPTAGKDPEKETLEAASLARANDITISLVGIKLSKKRNQARGKDNPDWLGKAAYCQGY